MNGSNCDELLRLNPGLGLGAIVRARVEHSWDLRKEEYTSWLYQKTKEKYQKSQLEAIEFASDAMSVYHKMWGDKFKRFIQTGNPEELSDFRNMSFKNYKDFTDMLLRLTGQDNSSNQKVSGEVVHKVETSKPTIDHRPLSSSDAASILQVIDSTFKK